MNPATRMGGCRAIFSSFSTQRVISQLFPLRPFSKDTSESKKAAPNILENEFGRVDAEGIRRFRRLEDRLDEAYSRVPKQHLKNMEGKYWPNKSEHLETIATSESPDLFNEDLKEKPYDELDLDNDEDFAKAMSYISNEHSIAPISGDEYEGDRFPVREILKVSRHTQITAAGRVYSFSALVLLGTGKGTAGLGYGRGNTVPEAVMMAKRAAEKNMISLNLHRGTSIGADIKSFYKKKLDLDEGVSLWPRNQGVAADEDPPRRLWHQRHLYWSWWFPESTHVISRHLPRPS